jgi:HAD superfamily hydrolase (TIGR01490 family)
MVVGYTLLFMHRGFETAILRNRFYLRGLSVHEVMALLPEFCKNHIIPRLSPQSLQWIKTLRLKGYEVIFISGTLNFILDYLVEYLGAQGGIGAKPEIRRGLFTGRVIGVHPYYRAKIDALETYLNGRSVDYRHSYCFGDSWTDIPLMSHFGHPVAMNPSRVLERKARRMDWQIIRDEV